MSQNQEVIVTIGGINAKALINRMGPENARRYLADELVLVEKKRRWTDNGDDTTTFTLPPTEALTGPEIIERVGENNLSIWAKEVLNSEDFTPAEPDVVYQVTVLKGALWSSNNDRSNENIRAEAEHRGHSDLPAEAAYLIHKHFTNQEIREMGISWIVVMHKPIKDSDVDPVVLCVAGDGSEPSLFAGDGRPGDRWRADRGFAFGSRK